MGLKACFLSLPTEVRFEIYAYLLPSRLHEPSLAFWALDHAQKRPRDGFFDPERGIPLREYDRYASISKYDRENWGSASTPHLTCHMAILQVNKLIHEEAAAVFWRGAKMLFGLEGGSPGVAQSFFEQRQVARSLVQDVTLQHRFNTSRIAKSDYSDFRTGRRYKAAIKWLTQECGQLRVLTVEPRRTSWSALLVGEDEYKIPRGCMDGLRYQTELITDDWRTDADHMKYIWRRD